MKRQLLSGLPLTHASTPKPTKSESFHSLISDELARETEKLVKRGIQTGIDVEQDQGAAYLLAPVSVVGKVTDQDMEEEIDVLGGYVSEDEEMVVDAADAEAELSIAGISS